MGAKALLKSGSSKVESNRGGSSMFASRSGIVHRSISFQPKSQEVRQDAYGGEHPLSPRGHPRAGGGGLGRPGVGRREASCGGSGAGQGWCDAAKGGERGGGMSALLTRTPAASPSLMKSSTKASSPPRA
jgi:hypothetical protein